jgi:hypothetical protein
MGRFGQSVFYGFLMTFYFMCFYYAFGVFQTLFEHGDVVKFAADSVVVGFVVWIFASFACYEIGGWFEEINRPRDKDRKDDDGSGSQNRGNGDNNDAGGEHK